YLFLFDTAASSAHYRLSLHERSSDLQVTGAPSSIVPRRTRSFTQYPACGPRSWTQPRAAHRCGATYPLTPLDLIWSMIVGSDRVDRKSTRLNSSHVSISYAGFCLKTT